MTITLLKKEKPRRRKPPTADLICFNQSELLTLLDIPIQHGKTTCWSCKKVSSCSLEKAHIKAFSKGGSDHPRNYLLLCHTCHTNQPDGAPIEYQIEWLQKRPQFWEIKFEPSPFMVEFERMAGIKIEKFCDMILDRHGTYGLSRIFKETLKGGSLEKAGMTTGKALANSVAAFVRLYRNEYLD